MSNKLYYQLNKEKIKEKSRLYRLAHPGYDKKSKAEYYERNRELVIARAGASFERDPVAALARISACACG